MRNKKIVATLLAVVMSFVGPFATYGQEVTTATPYEGETTEKSVDASLVCADVKYDLTEEMLADKAGEDYVENEVTYFADTQEDAEKIAEGYR